MSGKIDAGAEKGLSKPPKNLYPWVGGYKDYQNYIAEQVPEIVAKALNGNMLEQALADLKTIVKGYGEIANEEDDRSKANPKLENDPVFQSQLSTVRSEITKANGLMGFISNEQARFVRTSPNFRLSLEKLKI